jgi:Ca2+-binding EF-hand superfamily protein
MLSEWEISKARDKAKLAGLFDKYDDNKDGVLTLNEFEALIKSIDSKLKRQ